MRDKKVSRRTLAKYAGLLGQNSLAAQTLREYDHHKLQGERVSILMRNNGFELSFRRHATWNRRS